MIFFDFLTAVIRFANGLCYIGVVLFIVGLLATLIDMGLKYLRSEDWERFVGTFGERWNPKG